jgi:HEAT repeat protein
MVIGLLAFAAIAAYAGIHIRNFIRDKSAPRIVIAENAVPFTREIAIDPGKAMVLILPNNKTLAIWCERHSGIELAIAETALGMSYGEKPFTPLGYESIPLPNGGTTGGELLSYIRQGAVIGWPGKPKEYILYIDPYRISLKQRDITSSIRLLATVTQASQEEQVGPKREVDYLASRLQDRNPDVRLDAIRKLADLLICGSTYAELRETFIIGQLKRLKEDSNPQVREQVTDSLRSLGDTESILLAIQPQPSGRFLNTEEVRILGSSTKKCKDPAKLVPLYRHVLALFRSDQEESRKFAVLFFSFTDPVPEAREFLIKARHDPSPAVRAAAAHSLDNLYDENLHDADPSNDTQARDQAVEMLGDPAPGVVIAVLETSIYCGEHRQLPFNAVEPFLTSTHKGIRVAAIDAVHFTNTAESERLLLDFTHDQDSDIRAAAAQSLSQARSAAVGVRMVQLLQDADRTVRIRALQGLDGGQHTSALSSIKALLADETDPDVVRIANDALDHLTTRS